MAQIHVIDNRKEVKSHGNYSFPVLVSEESITRFESESFLWHWHPEIELTWIQSGKIRYCVNEKQYVLNEGEGLFGNSNALHSGYKLDDSDCEYLSITFHPRFLYGYENSLLQTKYVNFITTNTQWASLKLTPTVPWQKEVLDWMKDIYHLNKETPVDYELDIHILLTRIWKNFYHYFASLPEPNVAATQHLSRLKTIITYIQEHYTEPLTLEDIASSVNICKSECCRFFKKHMNMTLFEYLMFYRVQQSLPLLKDEESITKISGMVGFSNPCYFGKIFKRYMNCTPSQYKQKS